MIGSDCNEARPENRVRARSEHLDLRRRGQACLDPWQLGVGAFGRKLEPEAKSVRSADPVLLHQPDLVGPPVEGLQSVEKLVGEVGDPQKPLRQLAPLDGGAGPPAVCRR